MSIASLKTEIANLPLPERRELMGYIASLNRRNNAGFMSKLAGKLDDTNPERWIPLEEVERRLGL